ncbi:MAG: hypothetical protein M3N07_09925 [Pseudomonadota bacterium]|nr:hypothetical protein [Pseudomonadota bacterium]
MVATISRLDSIMPMVKVKNSSFAIVLLLAPERVAVRVDDRSARGVPYAGSPGFRRFSAERRAATLPFRGSLRVRNRTALSGSGQAVARKLIVLVRVDRKIAGVGS